LTISD